MTMHLDNRFSTINTKKRKLKLTKAKMAELEIDWRKHNKHCKQNHMHHFRYDTLETYIDYRFGRASKRPDPRDYRHFTRLHNDTQRNWRAEQDKAHREKYPSLMEEQMKAGTYKSDGEGMRKKEPMKYTGDLIQGIATMHKSNAVPVMKGTDQAKDIARMRRG